MSALVKGQSATYPLSHSYPQLDMERKYDIKLVDQDKDQSLTSYCHRQHELDSVKIILIYCQLK